MFRNILNVLIILVLATALFTSCGTSRSNGDDGEGEEARQQELDEIEALLGITPEDKPSEQPQQKESQNEDDMLGLLDAGAVAVTNQPPPTKAADPADLQKANKEITSLKSQLEKKDQLINDLKSQIRNQSDQIYQLETSKQSSPALSFSGASGNVAPGEYQQSYDEALSLFHANQYSQAIQVFEGLLASDAGNSLSDNAQFWIGECHYALRQYKSAIIDFEKVFTFPKSNKNDAAQFKLGLCYMRTGDAQKAREEFQRLVDVYPNSEYISRAREHLSTL